MENKGTIMLLPSPDYHKEEAEVKPQEPQKPPKQPKLSMKVLNEMIRELQQDNRALIERIAQLERQLGESYLFYHEAAATHDAYAPSPIVDATVEDAEAEEWKTAVPQPILTPRSIRHPTQKKKRKKTIWTLWL